jgi:hypothetical protein
VTVLYAKLAAVDFAATLFDTEDLATIRGASVAALRLVTALADHLEATLRPEDVRVDRLYASASEAVIRWSTEPRAGRSDWPSTPRGKNEKNFRRALEKALEAEDPEAVVEALWRKEGGERLVRRRGVPYPLDILVEWVRGRVAARSAPPALDPLETVEAGLDDRIATFLANPREPAWKHLCVLHASWRSTRDGLPNALVALDNRLRTRQLERWSLPPPPVAEGLLPAARAVCALTRVHPAGPVRSPNDEPRSASVIARRRSGIAQKQGFYEGQLARAAAHAEALAADPGELDPTVAAAATKAAETLCDRRTRLAAAPIGFARHFADIVDGPPAHVPVGIRGELAVVALDGNEFGKRRDERARHGFDDYRRFSRWLEVLGGLLLADLLDWMEAHPDMTVASAADAEEDEARRRLRFETLLWGGDEMLFVLPAWAVLDFLARLETSLERWREPESGSKALTFAIGAAVGRHKTPIRELRACAETLCTLAKGDRQVSRMQIATLRGLDGADLEVDGMRPARLGRTAADDADAWSLALVGIGDTVRAAARLLARTGRAQLHRWLRAAARDGLLGASDAEARARRDAMLVRLRDLGLADPDLAVLTEDRLGRGSRYPLLPLRQLLELADLVEASRLGRTS